MYFLIFFALLLRAECQIYENVDHNNLNIGNAIDVFANYGDLSQVTQVVSADYEGQQEEIVPFSEKNIRVFTNLSSFTTGGDSITDMDLILCESFDLLLDEYFKSFSIEGTDKPWKAFMGDWIMDEIMRTFGIENDRRPDDCCYVLVKLTKRHRSVRLNGMSGARVDSYIARLASGLDVSNPVDVRRFMKSYGTHYIESYVTGNFIYQVFKYKRSGYNLLKNYIRARNSHRTTTDNLRFYFSSYFLKQVGEIQIASGNKSVEYWARRNLRDGQYLYSRPSLLRLHYNPNLAYKLNSLLDNGALLGLSLKTLRPLFKEKYKGDKYAEIIENDLKLWEVNA